MSGLAWWVRRATRRLVREACRRLYVDRSTEISDSIVVAGTARSGTTWVGSTIADAAHAREVFEPFNDELVPQARPFGRFPYRRPEDRDSELTEFCRRLLSGELRGPWVDRYVDKLRPKGRVVKAVRANLLLGWMSRTFPTVPIVLLVRHPCAVASSREQAGWDPRLDLEALLSQERLVEDHLADHEEVIRSARSEAARRAVIWCVHSLVPRRQLDPDAVVEVSYEELCRDPDELQRLLVLLGVRWTAKVAERAQQPSAKSLPTSAVVTGENKIERWRRVMTSTDIDEVLRIVRGFGLGDVYDDSPLPVGPLLTPRPASEATRQGAPAPLEP